MNSKDLVKLRINLYINTCKLKFFEAYFFKMVTKMKSVHRTLVFAKPK